MSSNLSSRAKPIPLRSSSYFHLDVCDLVGVSRGGSALRRQGKRAKPIYVSTSQQDFPSQTDTTPYLIRCCEGGFWLRTAGRYFLLFLHAANTILGSPWRAHHADKYEPP